MIWFILAAAVLGGVMIYVGIGGRGRSAAPGDFNIYFVIMGGICLIPLGIALIKFALFQKKEGEKEDQRIKDLVLHGEQVIVDLESIEIHSNVYNKEIEVGHGYHSTNEIVEVKNNTVVFDIPCRGGTIGYTVDVPMDPTALKMHFALKKKTKLFIDPKDPNNSFLDLSFLDK